MKCKKINLNEISEDLDTNKKIIDLINQTITQIEETLNNL